MKKMDAAGNIFEASSKKTCTHTIDDYHALLKIASDLLVENILLKELLESTGD